MIFSAGDFRDFAHVVFYDFGHCIVVVVAGFAVLEENVAVFSHAAGYRSVGVERSFAEFCNSLTVEQRFEVFLLEHFDFLDFVRCAESVKEVYERHAALYGCEMSYRREVHNFLHAAFGKHCAACLACCHHVLVVAEDAECV